MNKYNQDISNIIYHLKKREINFFKGKNILILGSDGFIGKYFVQFFYSLIQNNINVKIDCVDNHISSIKLKKNLFKSRSINFYSKDILDFKTNKRYDLIIFLAGIASPKIYKKLPLPSLEVSYLGAKKYLKKSLKDKSLFVFFSSSEVYGNPTKSNIPTKENYYGNVNSYGPRACYDEGKRVGETLCYIFKEYYNCKIKVIRPFNVFGPGMDKNDDRVIPKFARLINKNVPITIYNNGNQTRSFCYISDAMTGFIKVICSGKVGEIYNVGNDKEEVSMNQLANKFQKIFTNKKIKIKKISYPNSYPSNEPQRRCPNLSKLYKDTGYKPKTTLQNSLRNFMKYF
tara:strand:- start:664 stop:1692 length:1029 start_codon:yes stop_codon:yes gene_type:complete